MTNLKVFQGSANASRLVGVHAHEDIAGDAQNAMQSSIQQSQSSVFSITRPSGEKKAPSEWTRVFYRKQKAIFSLAENELIYVGLCRHSHENKEAIVDTVLVGKSIVQLRNRIKNARKLPRASSKDVGRHAICRFCFPPPPSSASRKRRKGKDAPSPGGTKKGAAACEASKAHGRPSANVGVVAGSGESYGAGYGSAPGDVVSTDASALTRIVWSAAEDSMLEYAVKHVGLQWDRIHYSHFPHRGPTQLRRRWMEIHNFSAHNFRRREQRFQENLARKLRQQELAESASAPATGLARSDGASVGRANALSSSNNRRELHFGRAGVVQVLPPTSGGVVEPSSANSTSTLPPSSASAHSSGGHSVHALARASATRPKSWLTLRLERYPLGLVLYPPSSDSSDSEENDGPASARNSGSKLQFRKSAGSVQSSASSSTSSTSSANVDTDDTLPGMAGQIFFRRRHRTDRRLRRMYPAMRLPQPFALAFGLEEGETNEWDKKFASDSESTEDWDSDESEEDGGESVDSTDAHSQNIDESQLHDNAGSSSSRTDRPEASTAVTTEDRIQHTKMGHSNYTEGISSTVRTAGSAQAVQFVSAPSNTSGNVADLSATAPDEVQAIGGSMSVTDVDIPVAADVPRENPALGDSQERSVKAGSSAHTGAGRVELGITRSPAKRKSPTSLPSSSGAAQSTTTLEKEASNLSHSGQGSHDEHTSDSQDRSRGSTSNSSDKFTRAEDRVLLHACRARGGEAKGPSFWESLSGSGEGQVAKAPDALAARFRLLTDLYKRRKRMRKSNGVKEGNRQPAAVP